jgi:hypothetical protein
VRAAWLAGLAGAVALTGCTSAPAPIVTSTPHPAHSPVTPEVLKTRMRPTTAAPSASPKPRPVTLHGTCSKPGKTGHAKNGEWYVCRAGRWVTP